MPRRVSVKKPPVQMRAVLVELPENRMLSLSAKAKEAGEPLHVLAARIVSDWLDAS